MQMKKIAFYLAIGLLLTKNSITHTMEDNQQPNTIIIENDAKKTVLFLGCNGDGLYVCNIPSQEKVRLEPNKRPLFLNLITREELHTMAPSAFYRGTSLPSGEWVMGRITISRSGDVCKNINVGNFYPSRHPGVESVIPFIQIIAQHIYPKRFRPYITSQLMLDHEDYGRLNK